jgi:hypothetical protein
MSGINPHHVGEVLMQYRDRSIGAVSAALCTVLLWGCSPTSSDAPQQMAAAVAPFPPPPRRAEIPPAVPATDLLWLEGHWNWDGAKYVWTPGRYSPRPAPTANWLPGYWEEQSGGWTWTDGRWDS